MMVLPAVDILGGKVVQLVGGVPGTEKVTLPDPVEVAVRWRDLGAPGLHLIDLDAALGRGSNLRYVEEIIQALDIPVQVGGGVRSSGLVDHLLNLGAAAVIVGTRAIMDPRWLEETARSHPGKIILAMDVREGKVQIKGWREPVMRTVDQILGEIEGVPLAGVLHTDVDVEGREEGISVGRIADFVRRCPHPVIVSGGVSDMSDIRALSSLNIKAVVVGSALYSGRLDPEQLWRKEL